jgi:hypothetical protein
VTNHVIGNDHEDHDDHDDSGIGCRRRDRRGLCDRSGSVASPAQSAHFEITRM